MNNVNQTDFFAVTAIIESYFEGLHQGDTERLTTIFHPDAWLKSPDFHRSLSTWLDDVKKRPTPANQATPAKYKILSIDIVQDQAMVKVHCPLYAFNYVDFLGLLKEQGQWRIVNKMYTNVKPL